MAEAPTSADAAAVPEQSGRIRGWWRSYGWWVVGGLATAAFLMGLVGFERRSDLLGEAHSLQDSFYRSVQLFVLESGNVTGEVPWTLEVARFLAPLVFAYTAARALMALFRDQIRLLGLRFLPGHVIVCGLGDRGMSAVRSLSRTSRRVVVIERDAESDYVESARELGALVLIGDAQDPALLRRAGVARATHLVALCGADSTNAEIAVRMMRRAGERRGDPLGCLVHIVDPELCVLLRTEELTMTSEAHLTLEFFNIFEKGARALLDRAATSPFEQAGPGDLHLVVIGLGRFGSSVAVQAGRRWVAAANQHSGRFPITLVSRDATEKRALLCVRHPFLEKVCAPEGCLDMDIESAEFIEAPFLAGDTSAVYVCIDDDRLAVSAALTLRRRLGDREVPVVIRLAHAAGLGSLLGRVSTVSGDFETLHPFGLLDEAFGVDVLDGVYERMACELHGVWEGKPVSRSEWLALPDLHKASSRAQAGHTGVKLRAIECGLTPLAESKETPFSFTPAEIELLAMLEHDRWCEWTRGRGYRYGESRHDPSRLGLRFLPWVKGHHPQLKPWEQLDDEVKEVDREFVRCLPQVLANVDQQIVRLDERLPRSIHAAYLEDRAEAGETPVANPSLRAWGELPETLKNANRDQAAHLRLKLRTIGCDLAPEGGSGDGGGTFEFTSDEFEQLAELEHQRWVDQRRADGWKEGPAKDLDRKLSPYLVPWTELDEDVKELDRDVIRRLPEIAGLAGYRIVRGLASR
jgi:hypothetical protein